LRLVGWIRNPCRQFGRLGGQTIFSNGRLNGFLLEIHAASLAALAAKPFSVMGGLMDFS
jgi:hypothetical protein